MKKFLSIFIIITLFFCVVLNHVELWDLAFLLVATFFHEFFVSKFPFSRNICKHIVLWTIYVSVIVMPSYHIVYHILGFKLITQIDYERIIAFGVKVYFFVSLLCFIFATIAKKSRTIHYYYKPKVISELYINILFISLFLLTIFCYSIGLGRMGVEAVELPFHLSGIINLFRRIFVPVLFAIIVENYILRNKRLSKKYYVLFGLWIIMEMFAWMSKSVLINHLEPLIFVLLIYYKPSVTKSTKYLVPIIAAFLFLYPIIGAMRYADDGSFVENFSEAKKMSSENEREGTTSLLIPINRTFMTAYLYAQDYSYFDSSSIFDFSKFPQLFAMGGSAMFQTFVIDNYPTGAHHSSGTTGIIDPLLHGGYGTCFVFIALMVLLASLSDKILPLKQISIFVVLLLFVFEFSNFRNITMLYDSTGLQSIIVRLLAIYFAYKVNFKRHKLALNK